MDAVAGAVVEAWLEGRSLARGLPAPVRDRGGFRVDTANVDEIARWVFAAPSAGLIRLGHEVAEPGYRLKLCGTANVLRTLLPAGWRIDDGAWFMIGGERGRERQLPNGYRAEIDRGADVTTVRIRSAGGDLVASGHAAGTPRAFVYDRIATMPAHRRRGLAAAVMTMLRHANANAATSELLVATAEGAPLYRSLGWRTLSPYATAVWAAA